MLIMMVGGARLPILRPNQMLARHWPRSAEARIAALAEQMARVLSVFIPDVVVVETDGARGETVVESLRNALRSFPEAMPDPAPRFSVVYPIGLAEQECVDRLRLRLVEALLADAKGES